MSSLDFEVATDKKENSTKQSLKLTPYLKEVIPKIKVKYISVKNKVNLFKEYLI